ncbi:MAG TPA: hypothetical protein VFV35_01590 [Acidimicrobiales bacterium]|nr:hypothetical protein [Acidimicrobiales bacterium]
MSTVWCPECGAEYRPGVTTCADDGATLVEGQPGNENESEVVVYELGDWTEEQRGALELRLNAEGVEHQWEAPTGADVRAGYDPGQDTAIDSDLVVGEQDEELVDRLLDEDEFPEALVPASEDGGGNDEADYEVMSHLYVAADRLKDDPSDLAVIGDFFDAADAASAIEAPFGVDGEVWRHVQRLGSEIARLLEEEANDDVVQARSQELRDILFGVV